MQFGRLTVTNVFSQQKGETSAIEMEGGAQTNVYEVPVIDYDQSGDSWYECKKKGCIPAKRGITSKAYSSRVSP